MAWADNGLLQTKHQCEWWWPAAQTATSEVSAAQIFHPSGAGQFLSGVAGPRNTPNPTLNLHSGLQVTVCPSTGQFRHPGGPRSAAARLGGLECGPGKLTVVPWMGVGRSNQPQGPQRDPSLAQASSSSLHSTLGCWSQKPLWFPHPPRTLSLCAEYMQLILHKSTSKGFLFCFVFST